MTLDVRPVKRKPRGYGKGCDHVWFSASAWDPWRCEKCGATPKDMMEFRKGFKGPGGEKCEGK
jgi:hypothetical protein